MNHYQLLASKLPPDKRVEFRKLVDAAEDSAGCDIDDSFLGFIEDYVDLAAIVERHTIILPSGAEKCLGLKSHAWTVYDVGCATGFQHVLFPFAVRYVGIDGWFPNGPPTPLLPNAEFIHGRFADIADSLKIERDWSFGIANMSLAYLGRDDDLEAFDRLFLHKFMI